MMNVDFFIEMAWKSALISGGALGLAALLRSRAPADRAAVLRLGLSLLLMLPLVALFAPALQVEAGQPEAAPSVLTAAELMLLAASVPASAAAAPEPGIWDDPTPLLLILYLGGLAMIASRLIAGVVTLTRWTRSAEEATCPVWREAFERALGDSDASRDTRLLVSAEVNSPLSWGWRRPVILLDTDTHKDPSDADAIIAHEMAHIERGDWPTLVLARLAVALFWFNPLVHLAERAMLHHAEEAADAAALGQVEPARYAQTLLNFAGGMQLAPLPANRIGSGAVGRRVRAVLDGRLRRSAAGSLWTLGAMTAAVVVAAPLAALELIAPQPPEPPQAPEAPKVVVVPAVPRAPDAPATITVEVPATPNASAITIEVPPVPAAPLASLRGVAEHLGMTRPGGPVGPRGVVGPRGPVGPRVVATPRVSVGPIGPLAVAVQGMHPPHGLDEEDLRAIREAARIAAEEARKHGVTAEQARQIAAHAEREVLRAMRDGAVHMEEGARGMLVGANQMEREARRLRDRDYRERQIAEARQQGRTLTHEELIEAIPEMEEGAQEMREGAEEMRRAAREMRDGRR